MSLALRLMLVLLVPIALCFAGYGYVNVRLRRAEMLSEAVKEVRDHGTALEVALDAFIRDRNLDDMAELTEDLERADRILGVMVFDAHDQPVLASRSVVAFRGAFERAAGASRRERRPHAETQSRGGRTLYAYAFPIGSDGGAAARGSAVVLRDLGYIEVNLRQSARRIALAGAFVMAVVALGAWLAVRAAVLRPVARLVAGVEQVAAGAFDAEVAVTRGDEVGRMAAAFNRMTTSLRSARDALEAQNAANVALERRLHHAQHLALIGQLSANIAHQIGSPLNVILGRARYALKQGGQSERDARHFAEIVAGAESISGVIERLLSQARRVRGPAGPVDLGHVAQQIALFLEAECERLGVEAVVTTEPGVIVEGTRDELEQVILNLCANALQAQPEGGYLELAVRRRRGADGQTLAELAVEDSGPGIPVELRERVLEAFFTTKPRGEGTGLGLAICEEIVRRQGGTIVVGSSVYGGALFRVTLPSRAIYIVPQPLDRRDS